MTPQDLMGHVPERSKAEEFKDTVKQAIEAKLGDSRDQIMVDIFEGGVRIQLVDKADHPMFDVGSSQPTGLATRIMEVIGEQIKVLPNQVSIEGHTDFLHGGGDIRGRDGEGKAGGCAAELGEHDGQRVRLLSGGTG